MTFGTLAVLVAAGLGVEAGVLVLCLATSSAAIALPLLRERRVTSEAALVVWLLALAGLAYAAERAGTSILVAGFSAGLIVAAVGEPRRLARQVRGLAHGFLVPVFFVVLGARLVVGATLRLPLGVGLLAAATLGVPAAVVEVGLDEGFLDAGQAAGIIAAALGSIAFAALGSDRLHRQAPHTPAGQP